MDIARPEFRLQKRRRQIVLFGAGAVLVVAVSIGVMRLKPAAPSVERGTVWTDLVKRGSMLRQVRGPGSLMPVQEAVRQIPAETEATVVRIRVLPGSQVQADTVLVDMINSQVEQAAIDAGLQLKADELTTRNDLEGQRLTINQKAIDTQLAQEQAKVDQARTLADLKKKQLDALKVRAGISGVLVDLPLQVGQHVQPGTMLAKVVQPEHLMATLKIAETQARDVQFGEPAS